MSGLLQELRSAIRGGFVVAQRVIRRVDLSKGRFVVASPTMWPVIQVVFLNPTEVDEILYIGTTTIDPLLIHEDDRLSLQFEDDCAMLTNKLVRTIQDIKIKVTEGSDTWTETIEAGSVIAATVQPSCTGIYWAVIKPKSFH